MSERAQRKPLHIQLTQWEDERLRVKAQTLRCSVRDLIMKAVDAYSPTPETNRMEALATQIGELRVRAETNETTLRALQDSLTKRINSAEAEAHRRIDQLDKLFTALNSKRIGAL